MLEHSDNKSKDYRISMEVDLPTYSKLATCIRRKVKGATPLTQNLAPCSRRQPQPAVGSHAQIHTT